MSGTTVTYGQIVLENCQTEQFIQSCKYDPSQTDLLYHEYTITVSTVVYGNSIGKTLGATNVSGSTPTTVQEYLRAYLMHPRGAFTYSTNGDLLLGVSAADDVANGPQPVDCQITSVTAASFLVRWTIKLAVVQCPVGGFTTDQNGNIVPVALDIPEVLNHRWNYEETVDDNWYRRRTWNGTIRVRNMATPPHLFRNLVVPPLARGYKRESMRFTQEPNGLVGAYQIVDVSVDATAPAPATSWGGSHVRQLGIDGAKQNVDVHVWMKGPPGVDKVQLFDRCLQVTFGRIGTFKDDFTLDDGSAIIIESASLVEHMGEEGSRVETHLRCLVTPNANAKTKLGVKSTRFDRAIAEDVPDYDRFTAIPLPPYDPSTPVGSFFTYFQSPCGGPKGFPQFPEQQQQGQAPGIDQNSPLQQGETDRPQPVTNVSTSLPPDPKPTSASQTQSQSTFYSQYQISSVYQQDPGKVVIPTFTDVDQSGKRAVVVQRRPPSTARAVEIYGERYNAPVEFPDESAPEDEADLSYSYAPEAPQLAPDGVNVIYRARWKTRRGKTRYMEMQDVMQLGAPPWIDAQKVQTQQKLIESTRSDILESFGDTQQ